MSGNSEMVERVAKAIDECPEWPAKTYRARVARAAIEALMEPSISMEAAAVDIEEVAAVDWVNALFATGIGSAQQIIVAGYRAMLSEALSPSLKEQERT